MQGCSVAIATESRFVRACQREPVDATPVWFMRQAGRALPEYRALREKYSLVEITRNPELCAEVTLQPLRILGVDAAILFADITTPLIAAGIGMDIVEAVGPVVERPIRDETDLDVLRPLEPDVDLPYVAQAIRLLKAELGGTPLIGFAGAPFTLASYLIEGKPSRTFLATKAMMYRAPVLWHELMRRLADLTIAYLRTQALAGADALQLFDSWVGCLAPRDYAAYVRPHVRRIFASLSDLAAVTIHFGTETATLLPQMRDDGADVIGVDWRIPLDVAWETIGPDRAIQGNLDPAALFGDWETVEVAAADVLRRVAGRPGHVFNLGHGVHPGTPVDHLRRLVDFVHRFAAGPGAVG
jgi:uroporphyrinogen decarboxylase